MRTITETKKRFVIDIFVFDFFFIRIKLELYFGNIFRFVRSIIYTSRIPKIEACVRGSENKVFPTRS